ncbi:hypothetical protein AYI70_g2455 [Smittium culicis]|uniref:DUF7707 domain-containing protein n=1 Tax=Smittium culicis TaxID=133412 RepID=A0A1R1Y8C9_9FUNG|nr:hypothetical protein AYI70_g2455 [Smittium culicis]
MSRPTFYYFAFICLLFTSYAFANTFSSFGNEFLGLKIQRREEGSGDSKSETTQNKSEKETPAKKPKQDTAQNNIYSAQKTWCNDNSNFCTNICLNITAGSPRTKTCNYKTLEWNCVCGNGTSPDPKSKNNSFISYSTVFTFPISYYKCTDEVNKCQKKCSPGDNVCAASCANQRTCTAVNDPNVGKVNTISIEDDTSAEKKKNEVSASNLDYLFNSGSLVSSNFLTVFFLASFSIVSFVF